MSVDKQRRAERLRDLRRRRLAQRVEIDGSLVHPNPPKGHGDRGSYVSYGCRCARCRAASSAYARGLGPRALLDGEAT